jgi:hypothetical protein
MKRIKPQPESVADFKQRIAKLMRERETGKKFSVIGGPRADDCVKKKQTALRRYKKQWEKSHGKAGRGELSRCNIFCD